jgi:hypothetical protein
MEVKMEAVAVMTMEVAVTTTVVAVATTETKVITMETKVAKVAALPVDKESSISEIKNRKK